jgi:chromosome segregation protein
MYLKKLELIGFKSFAEKTEFTFPQSVTAIVGPNGCGKSNVVDAFKWIFGEQSAKGLRGEEMKDVIFNGTQNRKPTGLAEVTVVFDNADHGLDIDYSEVAITRRLYRSGESEYLINKQKCRLRDIRELLLDTGLGTSSYSMLEQGKIDVLLQASTLDRRIIFEEAAGISRYRVKKAETLRALERTSENLSRLGDIIDEVEKRIHRVKVQAGKARKYREYYDRLRSLRVKAALADYRSSIAERVDLTSLRLFADQRLARKEELLGRLREGLERHRAERRRRQAVLGEARERLAGARQSRERTEERIRQDGRRQTELAAERERRIEERAAGGEAQGRLLADLEREKVEKERAAAEIAERRALLDARAAEEKSLRLELEAARRVIEAGREAVVAALQERSRVGNRLVQLAAELGSLAGRAERTALALKAARAEGEAEEAKGRGLEGELSEMRLELERFDRLRGELDQAAGGCRTELLALLAKIAELSGLLQDRRSRLDVLSSLEVNREGLGGGVASVLEAAAGCPAAGRVLGMVADLLQVERRYAPAVEAVLGDRAQCLVVESQEGGLALLGLAQEAPGGVEVIALDRVGGPASAWTLDGEPGEGRRELTAEGGVLGFLRDHVQGPAEIEELIDRLLWGVILVEDLPTAVALSRNGLRPHRLVTLDGARVEPWGSMATAGRGAAGGLISRKSEMAELTVEIGLLEKEQREILGRRDRLAETLAALERDLREAAQAREAAALKLGTTESLLGQTARERERAQREVRVGESELAEIAAEEAVLLSERAAAEEEARSLDLRRGEEERALSAREAALIEDSEKFRVAGEAVTEERVRLAEAEERDEGLCRTLRQLSEALEERAERQRTLEEEIEELTRRGVQTAEDLRGSESALGEILAQEEAMAAQVMEAEAEDQGSAEVEAAFGAELDRLRALSDQVRKEREGINLREQEGKLKRNAMVEKIADEYGLDLAAIAAGAPGAGGATTNGVEASPEAASSGTAAAQPEPFEEGPDWNPEAAEAEIHQLREKLRHLGNVNLEALDELAELEERQRFMASQREDLRKAERDLKEIIAEINRTSRELFQKTFEAVQLHFGEIFRKCFGGGMAELVLEEGADVLEAGIEIIARPPGKKLTSLSLMSGGEKTMTTIALLFAIFRSRPSPFCILDEVDAPLDENNVRRFVVLLRDFVKSSQFIIITHNKITMAEADSLYGVTMQERGVSKRVAVEFATYDPDAPPQPALEGAGGLDPEPAPGL